jgi:hypothetical protein
MGVTVLLAIGALIHPEFPTKLGISQTPEQTLLIRQVLPILILFLGTFATLHFVVKHFKNIQKNNMSVFPVPTPYEISEALDPDREKILAIVAMNKLIRDSQISDVAKISEQLATLHLNELKSINLIGSKFSSDEYMRESTAWYIKQQGLKYLHHHGFL